MRECWEDDAKGTVSDIEGARRLGGREMPRSIRDGICVGVVVVVVVVVVLMGEMGAMGVVVLMVVVGIMVLAMVVRHGLISEHKKSNLFRKELIFSCPIIGWFQFFSLILIRAFKFIFSGWSTLLFIEVGISESNTKGCSSLILFPFKIP